jgi:hypothetical protein
MEIHLKINLKVISHQGRIFIFEVSSSREKKFQSAKRTNRFNVFKTIMSKWFRAVWQKLIKIKISFLFFIFYSTFLLPYHCLSLLSFPVFAPLSFLYLHPTLCFYFLLLSFSLSLPVCFFINTCGFLSLSVPLFIIIVSFISTFYS